MMILVTYPRTGVNFLFEAIKFKTGVEIEDGRHQEVTHQQNIINVVRDPKESMISWISMADDYEDPNIKNNTFDSLVKVILETKYIKMYNFLLSRDTIFINYKDFSKIDSVIEYICNKLGLEIINNQPINQEEIHKINRVKLKDEGGYLLTSKDTAKYQEYKEKIDSLDLSKCYDLYYKALDRCIKLDNEI